MISLLVMLDEVRRGGFEAEQLIGLRNYDGEMATLIILWKCLVAILFVELLETCPH